MKRKKEIPETHVEVEINVIEKHAIVHQGANIKAFRIARDYTQLYLATEIGISHAHLSRLEKQETVDDAYLNSISKILGIDLFWLKGIQIRKIYTAIEQSGQINYFHNKGNISTTHFYSTPSSELAKVYQTSYDNMQSFYKSEISNLKQTIEEKDRIICLERENREKLWQKLAIAESQLAKYKE